MNASTAIADSLLRQAGMRLSGMPAGGLAPRGVNVLFQVRLRPSGLRAPVSQRDCAISSLDWARDPEQVEGSRTVMNNARWRIIRRAGLEPETPRFEHALHPLF
jgi:hypothetical protein